MASGLGVDGQVRVLATDAQDRSVVAAIRSLSASGLRVTAVGNARQAPGLWSRAAHVRRLAPDPRRDAEGFIARLEQILSGTRHDLLLAGTDVALLTVSGHRDRLAPYVELGLPSHEIVQRSLDREQLAIEAAAVGLAPPEAHVCRTVEDALRAAGAFGYPVVVKPVHVVVESGGAARRRSAVLVHDARAAESAARALGTCIVQRRVNGFIVSFAGVATADGLLGLAISRYRRTWPPEAGSVCFSETISGPPGLEHSVESLLERLGWRGIFELELIERPGLGLSAIDFNPRPYGSLALAVAAGAPLPAVWGQWLLGRAPRPARARIGVRYRWEDADLRHLVWQARHGHLSSALSIARPRRAVAHAYFQARDPGPLLARGVQLARDAGERVQNKGRATDHEEVEPSHQTRN
ncbi:MAG TPA: hypothetical protein VMA77_07705 [Solirubrobacteraceae bacterium]|nr:hypothetical protein [Solirubrobacteraceae bacterium]